MPSAAAKAAQSPSPGMILDKTTRTYRAANLGNTRDRYQLDEQAGRRRALTAEAAPARSATTGSGLSAARPVTTMRKVVDTVRSITGRRR